MLSHLKSHSNELKQQGAVEAAQDPESNVTAGDAEKALVDETKKAGGVAFQFDPDATPEEKAAQARARVPPGFHHEKKSKGVAVATDIDDGTPDQYDMPPPSKEGAIEASTLTANGNVKQANGRVSLSEDDKWARDRTGWAPRFGTGKVEDGQEEESLLDHQTFLEGKLDDKFFGDWYHNTGVIIFACLSSWLVALLGGGLGWIFIVMAFCGSYYRTSIRRVRRNFRDDVNREMAKSRLEQDHESLEWINSFLVKFWPIYAPVLCDTIIASVDQVLSTATPAFLDSLRMKTFVLGSKPPRLEHVKTYPKAEDDIVLMDWKFSFTPNDVMDLTARQLKNKINPKVVLEVRIGKAMISKGLDVIVEDFAFSGLMRVKVKLQIPFPHVEKVEICFLGRPEIDYVCKPLGGDTLGFDINFIPGLESFITEQIHGNLGPMMYDPNVFPIEIAKMLAGNAVDQAIGVLAVTVHGAQGLKNPDKFSGTPDPYAVVSLNGRNEVGRTKTVHENANPKWNQTLYVIITSFTDALTLQIYDFNEYRKDKELGTATFALDQVEADNDHENLQLEVMSSGRARGVVQADVRFFPVMEGRKLEDGTEEPPPESNTGIARFSIEQAKELDGSKSLVGQLSPYAVLLLNGKEIHTTKKLKRTNNPIFPDPSTEILLTDRKAARLGVVIKDDRDMAADPILGKYQIKVDDMLQMMEKGQEWFNLAGVKTGRAKMHLDWKPVALKGIVGGSGGYITPIGVMRIHVHSAKDLRNVETLGKSDPYARVLLSGLVKGRTVTFQNNLNPDWDEVIYVPMHSTREKLTLEVMDEENLGKDRSLGLIELSASDYIKEGSNGEYEVIENKQLRSEGLRMNLRAQPKGTLSYSCSFYPTMNVADPEEEEEERKAEEAMGRTSLENGKPSLDASRKSVDGVLKNGDSLRKSIDKTSRKSSIEVGEKGQIGTSLSSLPNSEKESSITPAEKTLPKLHLTAEDLPKYESGLLIFKIIEGTLAHSNVQLEVVMDDMVFPSYVSSKARSKFVQFGETGDAMVRELDASKITLRLTEKTDNKGKDEQDDIIAKLTGATLPTIQQCLYKPTELTLRGTDGSTSKVVVSLKYLPVKMTLDPSESMNNMGTLRVDVLDAADLPSADRNGYSDPYCKFVLNGKDVFKTKVQKKTLHPAWNEFFEVPIKSRTAANFKVDIYDWDFGDKADFLGSSAINLELLDPFQSQVIDLGLDGKSGTVRLKMLFKPDYVVRSRQGSSTFSGTFAPAGKVIGAPVKGVSFVGGGVVKGISGGASFLRKGFKSKKGSRDDSQEEAETVPAPGGIVNGEMSPEATPQGTPSRAVPMGESTPTTPVTPPPHNRSRSFGSMKASAPAPSGSAETGTATFNLISASGFPPSANVRATVKMVSGKGSKEVHKTKAIKSGTGQIQWENETFKVPCAADTQFQIKVVDHGMFGGGDELGEALVFVDDQGSGAERSVKAGSGTVVLRSTFTLMDAASSGRNSPDSKRTGGAVRRSFLSKKEPSSRGGTPS